MQSVQYQYGSRTPAGAHQSATSDAPSDSIDMRLLDAVSLRPALFDDDGGEIAASFDVALPANTRGTAWRTLVSPHGVPCVLWKVKFDGWRCCWAALRCVRTARTLSALQIDAATSSLQLVAQLCSNAPSLAKSLARRHPPLADDASALLARAAALLPQLATAPDRDVRAQPLALAVATGTLPNNGISCNNTF